MEQDNVNTYDFNNAVTTKEKRIKNMGIINKIRPSSKMGKQQSRNMKNKSMPKTSRTSWIS